MAQKTALSTIATPGQVQVFSAKTAAITAFPVDDDDVYTPDVLDLYYIMPTQDRYLTLEVQDNYYEAKD